MAVAGAKGVVICIIIVIIDIAAGVLGIQAESAQNKVRTIDIACRDQSLLDLNCRIRFRKNMLDCSYLSVRSQATKHTSLALQLLHC